MSSKKKAKKKEVAPHSEAGVAQPAEARPWPPTESAGISAAAEPASLSPLALNVSGEGSLAPRKDTKKKDPAPETKECAHCLAPDNQHGVALKACIRCKAAFYCGRACQTAHWRAGHKQFCVTPGERVPSLPPEEPLRKSSINGPEDTSLDRADECAICLEPLGDSGPLCALPCSHKFHASCVEGLRSFGIKQVCPICRVDLPPGPEQLFEEATRRYFDVQRRVDRGEASWGALTKTKQREMDEVLLLWRSAAEQGHAGGQ